MIFLDQIYPKWVFPIKKTEKVNTTIKFYIFKLAKVPNFSLNWQFWIFWPNSLKRVFPFEIRKSVHHHWNLNIQFSLGIKFALKGIPGLKQKKWTPPLNCTNLDSLSWNLVPRLIRICRMQWWCLLFLFSTVNTIR